MQWSTLFNALEMLRIMHIEKASRVFQCMHKKTLPGGDNRLILSILRRSFWARPTELGTLCGLPSRDRQ
jgi:hypothetical protein